MKSSSTIKNGTYLMKSIMIYLLLLLLSEIDPCHNQMPNDQEKNESQQGNFGHFGEKYKNHSLVKLRFNVSPKFQYKVYSFFQMVRDIFHPWTESIERILQTMADTKNDTFTRSNRGEKRGEKLFTLSRPNSIYDVIDILGHIHNDHMDDLILASRLFNISKKVVTGDMSKLINQQVIDAEVKHGHFWKDHEMKFHYKSKDRKKRRANISSSLTFHPRKYNSIEQITEFMQYLKKDANERKKNLSVRIIGSSYEGQPIYSVEIDCLGNGSQKLTSSNKCSQKLIVLECGIHAREWISPAVCLWIIDYLSKSKYPVNQKVSFIIIPIVNPDGYRYTWKVDRLWRKNRSLNLPFANDTLGFRCIGVDLNRNFNIDFISNEKVSPCSEVYPGISAMSEPEVKSLSNYIENLIKQGKKIVAYFSIHSYSQLWLYPYGFSHDLPPNLLQLSSLAYKATQAIRSKYGTRYKIASVNDLLYKVSGSSLDYFYMASGINVTFAIELPDEGEEGFLLHPKHIEPTAIELLCGIEATIQAMNIGSMNN